MAKPKCRFGHKAREELTTLEEALTKGQLRDLKGQRRGNIDSRLLNGSHNAEEDRDTLRALPVATLPGIVVWFVYVDQSEGIFVLLVTEMRGQTSPRPPLLDAAWAIAQARPDNGSW